MNNNLSIDSQVRLYPDKPTIIIAAYNEENCIGELLSNLGHGKSNLFQIVVICNGCTDNTENIIREKFPNVYLGIAQTASKSLAIRTAESLNIGFPRLYLDADIALNQQQAETLFKKVQNDDRIGLFVPSSITDTKSSSYFVDQYYQAWYSTGFVKNKGFGCGCYIINEPSRQTFNLWPELISDDGFLREVFNDIIILKQVCVTVAAPKTLFSLLKIKTRSKYGNIELKKYLSDNNLSYESKHKQSNKEVSSFNPLSLSFKHAIIYSFVNAYAKAAAHWNLFTGTFKWHRDNSNR